MLILPLQELPDTTQTVTINGIAYDLRLQWNPREEAWYLTIGLVGVDPAAKMKMVNGFNLVAPFQYLEGVPTGVLFLSDTVADYGRVGRSDAGLGKRFNLIHLTQGEVDAL